MQPRDHRDLFVLVGGWPASGKTTLARALSRELGLAFLSKDEVKESLMDELGVPSDLAMSRKLGAASVRATLRAARGCPGAVIDSTWFSYAVPLVRGLPGYIVEVRCIVDIDTARSRYRSRQRHLGHLDRQRSEDELWGRPVEPLGVGPVIDVDTSKPVDAARTARAIAAAARLQTGHPLWRESSP
ncbi:MAG: AAA family ATPase [Nocardioidaceae bacterium]